VAADLQLRTMERLEAFILNERARRGDREAIAVFREMWAADSLCFTCNEPVGAWSTTLLLPDGDDPVNRAVLAPNARDVRGSRQPGATGPCARC
jgi:hypothetical protein